MKKKQFMSKLAALTMAAAMGITALPATAVFAADTSVEASDTAIRSEDQVVVVNSVNGNEDVADRIKETLKNGNFDGATYYDKDATNGAKADTTDTTDKTKTALEVALIGTSGVYASGVITDGATPSTTLDTFTQVNNVKYTDADHYSFTLVGSTGTYDVTVSTDAVLDPTVKNALDNYFNLHEFKTTSDVTLRNVDIKNAIVADLAKTQASVEGKALKTALGSTYTYNGNGDAVASDGTGKLTITKESGTSAKNFTYSFTAKITTSEQTADEANKAAIEKINAKSYPYSTKSGHVTADLQSKIVADLKDAGYTGASALTNVKVTKAKADKDGSFKAVIDGSDFIDVVLKYSSDLKSDDANKSVQKVLGNTSVTAPTADKYTEHKASKTALTNEPDDAYALTTSDYISTISKTSKISTDLQGLKATKAATTEEAVKAVQDAVEAQLEADGIDNGVTVTAKAVNVYLNAQNGDTAAKGVKDGQKPAVKGNAGSYTILVTTSIANDFADWTDPAGSATTDVHYLVTLETNALADSKTTEVALADKTINLTGDYLISGNDKDYTYVEVTPTFTPEDANDSVTYKVVNKDGEVLGTSIAAGTVIKEDGNTVASFYKNKVETGKEIKAGEKSLGLLVKKAGTYTVTVTSGKKTATATITVNNNFKDVPATSYFANAVTDAYAGGVTNGVSATEFGANQNVTRAQFVTFLYNYAKAVDSSVEIKDEDLKQVYSDVPTTAYYAKAVQWAAENNVTSGTGNGKFSPDADVTRAQAVTLIYNAKNKPDTGAQGRSTEATVQFSDVKKGAYYEGAVTWGVNSGVVFGLSTTTFGPENVANRAQAISFIARAYASTDTITDKVFTHKIADYQ